MRERPADGHNQVGANRPRRSQPFPGCVALETKSNQPGRFQKLRIFWGLKKAEPADADTAIDAPERCALDMTNHLALIKKRAAS